uniref:CpsB/CapC family capsule biosynthesis tyrosine phosphatase n=1 Tax=Eubacterium cellulosolvens TaxID=29322 RepID=UPI00048550CD|nr:CpsB/CapC family capsule biosynthesis tyrosine phosphatase [[Eubacterium] cellulosolvens]
MSDYFDMHCHIIPDVDDGAKNIEISLNILKKEYKDGIGNIILTPHYRVGMFETPEEKIRENYLYLKEQVRDEIPGMNLYLGCEYHVNMEMEEELRARPQLRIADTQHVLLEFSGADSAAYIKERVYVALSLGYQPIIAHIERYPALEKDFDLIDYLRRMGAGIQINADAVLGEDGRSAKKFCRKLIKEDLVDFIGSDAHNMKERKPRMGEVIRLLRKKAGDGYVDHIFRENPQRILDEAVQ